MLHKTRGIVFRFVKYGEASIIVTIFTDQFGLQSYIVNSVRSSSAKGGKIALYQPLTLLDLVVYHRENATILRIKEVKCYYPYQTINTDFKKSTIALFLNEIINKSVKEQVHTKEMFDFLVDSFVWLDRTIDKAENFHLLFLIQLSKLLGFGPTQTTQIQSSFFINNEEEQVLHQLLMAHYHTPVLMTNLQRRNIVDILLRFYADHIDNFGEIKSIQVLREIIN